jgi:microcompartment protein CcmK/EutM
VGFESEDAAFLVGMSGPGNELENPSVDRIGMGTGDLVVVSAGSTNAFLMTDARRLLSSKKY